MDGPAPSQKLARYIVGPIYDWAFFLAPPLLALVLGVALSGTHISDDPMVFAGEETTAIGLALGILIHAHLVIVVFRSHGNKTVFKRFPYRFTIVPVALVVGMLWSPWLAVIGSVLATFWDVYHSGAQTFGFARIYDAKAGNDRNAGRKADFVLNQLLYAGPIVAGATMLDHFEDFEEFEAVGSAFFTSVPARMVGNHAYFTWAVLGAGAAFLVYYVASAWKLHHSGRQTPWQKTFILATTGGVSIYTWGFNTWGEAFLIMNTFHAIQYFGIVWATERTNMRKLFRLETVAWGKPAMWVLFVSLALGYGLAVEAFAGSVQVWWAITIAVSLLHFWYDGFIWSVRKSS